MINFVGRLTPPAALLSLTCVLTALSMLRPVYPVEQSLQHIPTVAAIIVLAFVAKRRWLSTTAFACIILFLWLHILGARYIYSFVPYDDWLRAVCGGSPVSWFDWRRNHYDRLVHFCFGLLVMVPAHEVAVRWGHIGRYWAIAFAACFVAALSAGYEIVEWVVAVVMSPQFAEAYTGQQGDLWDAQKDMALAFAGTAVMALWLWRGARRGRFPTVSNPS